MHCEGQQPRWPFKGCVHCPMHTCHSLTKALLVGLDSMKVGIWWEMPICSLKECCARSQGYCITAGQKEKLGGIFDFTYMSTWLGYACICRRWLPLKWIWSLSLVTALSGIKILDKMNVMSRYNHLTSFDSCRGLTIRVNAKVDLTFKSN